MAKLINGLLGTVSGKVGNMVFADYRGQLIVRSLPRKSKKKPTRNQLLQRERFKVVAEFLRPLRKVHDQYFGQRTKGKSRANLGMSYHLLAATDTVEGKIIVNLERVMITKGILPQVKVTSIEKKKLELTINWISITEIIAREKDLVNIVVYSEKHQTFHFYEQVAIRSTKSHTVTLPDSFTGKDNHVWIFLSNQRETQCSTSSYLGVF